MRRTCDGEDEHVGICCDYGVDEGSGDVGEGCVVGKHDQEEGICPNVEVLVEVEVVNDAEAELGHVGAGLSQPSLQLHLFELHPYALLHFLPPLECCTQCSSATGKTLYVLD